MDYEYADLEYGADWDFYNQSDEIEESWVDELNSEYYGSNEDPSEYLKYIEYTSIV
jgi:hypothetical protein